MRRLPPPLVLLAAALAFATVATLALGPFSYAEDEASEEAVLGLLAPRRGEVIADLGCGHGAWTFELARAVGPSGTVLAVDIDPDAIAEVKRRIQERSVKNVAVIQSLDDDPQLPAGKLDAIFLNDVIDWVERRALAGFLAGIREALKPDGRLVIRDPSGGPDRVLAELYRNGFTLVEAQIPLEAAPARSFGSGWYALKLRQGKVQDAILPRLGRPSRFRTRLFLAEEMYRRGLLSREELRAKWEAVRDRPDAFDPEIDESRDLILAARALDVITEEEAKTLQARVSGDE